MKYLYYSLSLESSVITDIEALYRGGTLEFIFYPACTCVHLDGPGELSVRLLGLCKSFDSKL